ISVHIAYSTGCESTASAQIESEYGPKANFSVSEAICSGELAGIENNSVIAHGTPLYTWSMGDGTVYNSVNPKHTYTFFEPTDVVIKLVATSATGACPDSFEQRVRVGVI